MSYIELWQNDYKGKYWKCFWNDCEMNILLLRWQMLKVSKIKRIYKTKLRKYKFTRVMLIWFAIILVFVKFVVWSHSNLNTKVSVLSTVKLKRTKQDKGKNEQQLNPRSADKTSLSALLPTNLHVLHVQTNTPAERQLTVGLISRNHVNKPTQTCRTWHGMAYNGLKTNKWSTITLFELFTYPTRKAYFLITEFVSYYLSKLRMISLWVLINRYCPNREVDGGDKRVKTCSGR